MEGNTIRRGQKMPKEAKDLISESLVGNKRRKDKPHTEETKRRISESLKRAYAEGRHKKPDIEISKQNIQKWNNR